MLEPLGSKFPEKDNDDLEPTIWCYGNYETDMKLRKSAAWPSMSTKDQIYKPLEVTLQK